MLTYFIRTAVIFVVNFCNDFHLTFIQGLSVQNMFVNEKLP